MQVQLAGFGKAEAINFDEFAAILWSQYTTASFPEASIVRCGKQEENFCRNEI